MKSVSDQQLLTANQNIDQPMYTTTMITPSNMMYDYPTYMENTCYSSGPMVMNNGSQVSLSEASVCSSSMGIRTPDVHPAPDTTSSVTQATYYGDQNHQILIKNGYPQQWNNVPIDPVVVWPMLNDPSSTHCLNNNQSYVSSNIVYGEKVMQHTIKQEEEEEASSSMRKSPHNRRNTVSLPIWCDSSNQVKQEEISCELRRQSMNDMNHVRNLSREQLIQRVVQLEKEKELSRKLSGSPISEPSTREQSDQDDFHPCRWTGCDTSTTSLDQLIVHIRDIHIGSGKAAYYCEWTGCARNQKPFLKRHKMQNHMRTHTGERPFECHIEDCDKKFSRPDSLNTHIKTHSSIRPYACPIENCGKAYFHSRSLRKHAKSHESNSNTPPPPHPYNRTLKPTKFYTPIITNTSAQQIPFSTFYSEVKIMENYEQQQQQILAAGPAYYPTATTTIEQQQQLQQQQYYVSNNNPPSSSSYNNMNQRYIY